jgi:Kinesin-associated protein (KAP)
MLEAHPREKSIIVNYKLEAAVYGDHDVADPMLADKKVRGREKRLATTTNIAKAVNIFLDISMP